MLDYLPLDAKIRLAQTIFFKQHLNVGLTLTIELYFTDKLYTANAVCLICMFADPVWFKMKGRLGCSKLTTLVTRIRVVLVG